MKSLILFRHAKSDWDGEVGHDSERALAGRGKKAAKVMGLYLAGISQIPDAAICSSARRAVDTLELASQAGGWKSSRRITDSLYEAHPADILNEIRKEPDSTETLLIVGHEPAMSETLAALTGARARFPTACMARVDLGIDRWRDAQLGAGQLAWLVGPKLISALTGETTPDSKDSKDR